MRSWYDPGSQNRAASLGLVRVAVKQIKLYAEPSYHSEEVGLRTRDQLLYYYDKFESPHGPDFNPRWYEVEGGYAHTAYLQPVDTILNPVATSITEGGQLAEITVPYTQSMRYTKFYGWQPLYRLYYRSVHWVTNVGLGPNGQPWYELTDDLLKITYWVPAKHMRRINPQELTPLSTDVPPHEKFIAVSIRDQTLTAYEGEEVMLHTSVSTGIPGIGDPNGVPTATPRGKFNIQIKMPVRHMGDGKMTSDPNAYELPGVPWVSFFHGTGVAFHGTYWHDNFGNEMSHGCVNMRPDEAKWLYRWVTPVIEPGQWVRNGLGTRVEVT